MRILLKAIAVLLLSMGVSFAMPAPPANNANALQRAVWACEGSGATLAKAEKGTRIFLSFADRSANNWKTPPLVLKGGTLSGVGSLSTLKGSWSNISFTCGLATDGRSARSFSYKIQGAMTANTAPPAASEPMRTDMTWQIFGDEHIAISHGVPETDDGDFGINCKKGSGSISVGLDKTVEGLKDGGYVTVAISNGPYSSLYVAKGVMSEMMGAAMPQIVTTPDDPMLIAMTQGSVLHINIAAQNIYNVSLKGAGPLMAKFIAGCRK